MQLSRKAFLNVLICVFQLCLQVAVLGTASQIYTYNVGETAKLLWRRSEREHFKEFRQYRAWKEEISFAIIINGSQTSRCLDDILKTFCLTKVKFQVWNETHLLLTIKNSSYDDSGDYSVEHVFEGLERNHKSKVSLKIQARTAKEARKTESINPINASVALTSEEFKVLNDKAKPTGIITSHHNSTKDDNRTVAKPTGIITSHHNSTKDDNRTVAKPTGIITSHHNSTKDDNRTVGTKRKTDGSLALYSVLAALFLSVLIWFSILMLSISRRFRQVFAPGLP